MKLTAMVFVSLDGVYQGGGGPHEDTRFGFERGGWQAPYGDDESGAFITSVYERMDAMLLGRTTFDIWEPYWPLHDSGDAVSHGINIVPKYVPSTTRTESKWHNTHFINGDVEARIRELKAAPGRDLLLQGSGNLLQWLLERDLVDELHLPVYPVVVGQGLRLFPERGQTHALELVESRATPAGITLQTYRPKGRATFGTIGD
jgi:dihydrofolate reductase